MLWHSLSLNKKVEKFQLCLKTAASLFPFSCGTFLIASFNNTKRSYEIYITFQWWCPLYCVRIKKGVVSIIWKWDKERKKFWVVKNILKGFIFLSNVVDVIQSEKNMKKMAPWHFVNLPFCRATKTYFL